MQADKIQDGPCRAQQDRGAQACRRLAEGCKRRLASDNGFKGGTYPPEDIGTALGGRACRKKVHGMLDSMAKNGRRPGRSASHYRLVACPHMVAPYFVWLDLFVPETVHTDETIACINGVKRVLYDAGRGASAADGVPDGQNKGLHGASRCFGWTWP